MHVRTRGAILPFASLDNVARENSAAGILDMWDSKRGRHGAGGGGLLGWLLSMIGEVKIGLAVLDE